MFNAYRLLNGRFVKIGTFNARNPQQANRLCALAQRAHELATGEIHPVVARPAARERLLTR